MYEEDGLPELTFDDLKLHNVDYYAGGCRWIFEEDRIIHKSMEFVVNLAGEGI